MDRRTIILCLFLVLIVLVLLNRWDSTKWETEITGGGLYGVLYRQDRLTSFTQISVIGRTESKEYIAWTHSKNEVVTHSVTVLLYLTLAVTVGALLRGGKGTTD